MGANSKIEWCDHTFNPWIGCNKVSSACKFCYAEVETFARVQRSKGVELWGPKGVRHRTSPAYWRQPLRWNEQAKAEGVRRRVFCASLADVFEDRPELYDWRKELFLLIENTPHLDWMLLTKRPHLISPLWPTRPFGPDGEQEEIMLDNVWLGASIEDQATADERIPHLLNPYGAGRLGRRYFLSAEPLLDRIDLADLAFLVDENGRIVDSDFRDSDEITLVIVGGESGAGCNSRPMHPQWVRDLRDQCAAARVDFFFKQWGEYRPAEPTDPPNIVQERFQYHRDGMVKMVRLGKHKTGHLLDGVAHQTIVHHK